MSLHQIWAMPATPIDHDALRRANEARVARFHRALGAGKRFPGRLLAALAWPIRAMRGHRVRRSTAQVLNGLNDRLLADIGLSRGMIGSVAQRAGHAARIKRREWLSRRTRAALVRRQMAELAQIDPALHSDIGLRPHNFLDMAEAIVDQHMNPQPAKGASSPPELRVIAGPATSPAARPIARPAPAQALRHGTSSDRAACA